MTVCHKIASILMQLTKVVILLLFQVQPIVTYVWSSRDGDVGELEAVLLFRQVSSKQDTSRKRYSGPQGANA